MRKSKKNKSASKRHECEEQLKKIEVNWLITARDQKE